MSESEDTGGHTETMRGRVNESRRKIWVLLDADRWIIAAFVLGIVFAALVVLSQLSPLPLRKAMTESDPAETLFQALVTATITGVTLVVTITQLVISQELGAVGDQRERMEGSLDFRQDVADVIDAPVSPPEPSAFLRSLVDATRAKAEALADAVSDDLDEGVRDRVDHFTEGLTDDAERVSNRLEGSQFGTFGVLFAALDYNYSWKIYEGERLREEYKDSLSDAAQAELDGVLDTLRFFGPAREHVKTLYFQWELTNLSRAVLYAAVPALIVAMAGNLFLDVTGTVAGTTLGVDNLVWVVCAGATISLTPFAILLAYVLRIATVAKRTLAIGPFVLRETDRTEDIAWDETND
ncbi:hypothetical protein ACKVMT_15750 [Halobacteriales archaeon Cl-PHB]